MEQEVARFQKNATETVIVKLTNFKGSDLVDIRAHVEGQSGQGGVEMKPTQKGLTLKVGLIPELIEALKKAETTYKETNAA